MLSSSVFLVLIVVVSTSSVTFYGGAKPPKEVQINIGEMRKILKSRAYVLPTTVSRKATHVTITVNLRGLPSHLNSSFILDELYINIQNGRKSNAQTSSNQELWIEEKQNKTLLARVPLDTSKTGYRAIKLRRVFASWLTNNKQTGYLKINAPSSQLATTLEKSKSYIVLYGFSKATLPTFENCESYEVEIRPRFPNAAFTTKICSSPEDETFPFNASKSFDVGGLLRQSLKDNPLPINAAVLRNSKCCHAIKALPRKFMMVSFGKATLPRFHDVELNNVEVTECGCGTL